MPDAGPSSERAFIWLITCVLFLSILAGGGCLTTYLVLPESQITRLLEIVGVTLVCLPWAFWLFTSLYRIFSQSYGFIFRVGVGAGNAPENSGVVTQQNSGVNRAITIASHESEMPLAKSMTG